MPFVKRELPFALDPTPATAFQAFLAGVIGVQFPLEEVNATTVSAGDGTLVGYVTPPAINQAIVDAVEAPDYPAIAAPGLAIYAVPATPADLAPWLSPDTVAAWDSAHAWIDSSAAEREVVDAARDPESLRWEQEKALSILEAVLDVALEDDHVSDDELRLIGRLREKLRVQEGSKQILLARLGHFPQPGNEIHSPSDFKEALNDLQRRGVVFYCNRLDGGRYLIPDEIAPGVKKALGIELADKSWQLLLESLTNAHLAQILEASGMPKSGTKEERAERVMAAGIQPSQALDLLSNQDLYDICNSLPGAKVSGSKQEKIDRIIEYFDNLVVKDVPQDATPGELYYEYLVELSRRDRENLLTNKVIKKDLHMERAFEEGLRYLFTEKLGLELVHMPGSDHPDGCIAFPNGDLFMWDAKSKEDIYTFPPTHMKQFKRYIRDAAKRVSCFMVIVPEVAPKATQMAARLKVESKTDTDVSLMAAEDLLWLAEGWASRKIKEPLNLEVFNVTGALDRSVLDQRMKLFR